MPHVSQVHHILGTMFARIISIQQLLSISLIRHRLHRTSTLFLDGVYLIQTEESKGAAPHWIPPWKVLLQQTSNKDGVFKEDDVHKRSGHSLGISLHERCHQQDRNLELKSSSLQETEDSTGETEAASVTDTLEDWNVTSKVIAVGFDTTTSNTGVNKGVCIRLQKSLKTPLLWMACRHHVLELILGKAFSELFGESSGPEIPLFKKLQDVWYDLDLTDLILPDIPPYLQNHSAEILPLWRIASRTLIQLLVMTTRNC